jgi:hypothetical protein
LVLEAAATAAANAAAAAEVETASSEAAVQVSARLGSVFAETGEAVEAESLTEVGFGTTVRSGLRTAVVRFSTEAGRRAFIQGLRQGAGDVLVQVRTARQLEQVQSLRVAIEELALEFGAI